MGNTQSQQTYLTEEFLRVSRLGPLPTQPPAVPEYIVLDQLLQLQPPRENPIDPTHLGTLYVLDSLDGALNGRFSLQDLFDFAELYAWQQVHSSGNTLGSIGSDFQSKFQAYCTLQMWSDLCGPLPSSSQSSSTTTTANNKQTGKSEPERDGAQKFREWFSMLFSENGPILTFEAYPGQLFLSAGTIKTMHQILGIKKMYGLDFQGFFDLLQRVAEERHLTTLQDTSLDDVVPKNVVESFGEDFIQGFLKLMSELGFEPGMTAESEESE